MHRFSLHELHEFLRLLDSELPVPVEVTIIGGAAIGLVYDPAHTTTDIDLVPTSDLAFWEAVTRARSRTARPIPVQAAGIYEAPYDWEERRQIMTIAGVKKMKLFVPEAHDLALMKVSRGLTHDLDAVEDMHRKARLDLDTLIERYCELRTQHVGSLEELQLGFVSLVDRLFGSEKAADVDRSLTAQPSRPVRSV
jgi:hypothetical protein